MFKGLRQAGYRAYRQFRTAAPYVKFAARTAKRAYNSYTNNSKRRKTTSSNNVTFQHDYANIYRRRSAPRRVKRAARKSYKRWNHQLVKSLGQQTWAISSAYASGTITPTALTNCQTVISLGLYGGVATGTEPLWTDLRSITTQEGSGAAMTGQKFHFKSACLDLQIRNSTSSFTSSPDPVTICVDLYTIYCRNDSFADPSQAWTVGMNNQVPLNAGTLAVPQSLNATPFDAPQFCSDWLIAKKTRYRIAPGNSVYLQLRDPKNHVFDAHRYDAISGVANERMFKGMTKGYIMAVRSADPVVGTPSVLTPYSFELLYTKNYKYAMQERALDQQEYEVFP